MMKKTSPSAAVLKDIRVPTNDERMLGKEPTWDYKYQRSDMIAALNWYNYVVQDRDRLAALPVDYVTENYGEDAIEALKALPWWRVTNRMVAFPRMAKRGYVLAHDEQERLDEEFRKAVETGRGLLEASKSKKPAVVISLTPKQIEKRQLDQAIADLDDEIDRFTTSKFKYAWDAKKWFATNKITGPVAAKIAKKYKPQLEELELAVSKKDAEVNEGYSHLKPANRVKLRDFVLGIVTQAEAVAEKDDGKAPVKTAKAKVKAEKKPRAKKAVDPKKLVSKLKYMLKDSETKLESVDPSKIHGASEVWLYNAKYRELTHYVADKGALSLKGQTLTGFTKSEMKKIRKPETLASMLEGTPKATYNAFVALKTTSRTENPGRINPHVLILRVVK